MQGGQTTANKSWHSSCQLPACSTCSSRHQHQHQEQARQAPGAAAAPHTWLGGVNCSSTEDKAKPADSKQQLHLYLRGAAGWRELLQHQRKVCAAQRARLQVSSLLAAPLAAARRRLRLLLQVAAPAARGGWQGWAAQAQVFKPSCERRLQAQRARLHGGPGAGERAKQHSNTYYPALVPAPSSGNRALTRWSPGWALRPPGCTAAPSHCR